MGDSSPPARSYKPYPHFLLYGDSITEGAEDTPFLSPLRAAYKRRVDILNRGLSGHTTRMCLPLVDKIVPPPPPPPSHLEENQNANSLLLFTLFLGANDATLPGEPQHVPLPEYTANLTKILTYPALLAHPDVKRIVITPAPVDEYQLAFPATATSTSTSTDPDSAATETGPSRTALNTRAYAMACREAGSALGLPVVDLWTLFMSAAGYVQRDPNQTPSEAELPGSKRAPRNAVLGRLLPDGLHFSDEAYGLYRGEFERVLERWYPELGAERVGMVHPGWDEVLGIAK